MLMLAVPVEEREGGCLRSESEEPVGLCPTGSFGEAARTAADRNAFNTSVSPGRAESPKADLVFVGVKRSL
jgi:hypothetical protein